MNIENYIIYFALIVILIQQGRISNKIAENHKHIREIKRWCIGNANILDSIKKVIKNEN